jgi:hypothetical protein
VVVRPTAAAELDEVAMTSISTGAAFVFAPRRALPLTPLRS